MANEVNSSALSSSGISASPLDPQSVEGIFVEALTKEAGEQRSAWLDAACSGNAELRTRVEALLRAYHDAGSFLQQPAGDWRNPPPTQSQFSPHADGGIPSGLLRASDDPAVLGTIGPYQVRELIGRGGMGIVFRAFDPKLNRVVAIKVLAPELASQPTARRRFLREAQAAAAVVHPHVVTIHAVDEDEPPYLVMECIVGVSLQEKIDRVGPLKLAEVLRIGSQIADGLAAAHKQGLIHRDVKPANILLENGVERVKITDFGLARAADDVTITRPGEISGTPQYMSPEQAMGQRVDQRSDLFSLGCVLYAMCASRPPFRGDSLPAIVRKICDEHPQPLREIDPQTPEWLAEIIDRLLAKDPNQRLQTADEAARILSDALARLQAGQVVGAAMLPAVSGSAGAAKLRPSVSGSSAASSSAAHNVLVMNPALPKLAQWICAYGLVISPVLVALQLASTVAFTLNENDYVIASELLDLPVSFVIAALLFVGGLKLRDLRASGVTWLKTGFIVQTVWLPVYLALYAAWMATDAEAYAALDQHGNGRDFISLSLAFLCYGFGVFALVWLLRNAAALPLTSEVPLAQRTEPAAPRLPMPVWLAVVVTGLAGYVFGRLVPMPTGQKEGWWFMSAVVVAAALLAVLLRRVRPASSTLSAVFVVVGIGAFLATSGIGHEQLIRYGYELDRPDWLAMMAGGLAILAAWSLSRQAATMAATAAPASRPDAAPSAVPTTQPWKVAGWLVVAMLCLMLLAPVLGAVALIVPYFQAQQARQDMRAWQATAARLTMTFDEDLPIVDVQIDGASSGPIEISPIERLVPAGQHTITIVYTHGDRKRSVREKANFAEHEERTLDLTPLVRYDMRERSLRGKVADRPGTAAGSPKDLRTLTHNDEPISSGAKWVGDELEVTANEAGSVRLFEVPLEPIEQSIILYRFRVKADNLTSSVYAEMWCHAAGLGEFFSRGLDQKVRGTTNWVTIEIPAFVQNEQIADSVKLNLVFEGPGKVRMTDIQVLAVPSPGGEPQSDTSQPEASLANIQWGRVSDQVQFGWRIEPKKEVYTSGDVLTVTLLLRNVGANPISISMPRQEVLEKLGLDVDLLDSNGKRLPWQWGKAHRGQELLTVSGYLGTALEPNVPFELPAFTVAIAGRGDKDSDSAQGTMIELDLKGDARAETDGEDKPPVQPFSLWFLLSSIGGARDGEKHLESAAFEFRVGDAP